MVNFGEKLKALRRQAGMTQAELARRLNVTKSVVSYYELQERSPSPDVLIRVAAVFHVTTDYLLGISREKTVDVSDLTEEEVALLRHTAEVLRKAHETPV